MKNIVFDIGNVLIAWDAHAAFRDAFEDKDEAARAALAHFAGFVY